jgi:osmotically-inducible protein OsmY
MGGIDQDKTRRDFMGRRKAMSVTDQRTGTFGIRSLAWAVGQREAAETAEDRLRHSAYPELGDVFCSFHEGVLTLRGRVSSYYLKQLAQTLIGQITGVEELHNQLEVAELHEGDRSCWC